MTVLSAKERGDMVEQLLPVAANLVALVHGDGGPRDVHQALARLDSGQREALLVILAGLVDPDQPMGRALGWLDFNEHSQTVVPRWEDKSTLRDLVPEPDLEDEDTYVDEVAVKQYVDGKQVKLSKRERLAAVVLAVGKRGMSLKQLDALHGLSSGATNTFLKRLRQEFEKRGEAFPVLPLPSSGARREFTPDQVVEIRERYARGGVTDLELGMQYGVARKTIGDLLGGVSYQHVGGPIRAKRGAKPGRASRTVWGTSTPGFLGSDDKTKEIAA